MKNSIKRERSVLLLVLLLLGVGCPLGLESPTVPLGLVNEINSGSKEEQQSNAQSTDVIFRVGNDAGTPFLIIDTNGGPHNPESTVINFSDTTTTSNLIFNQGVAGAYYKVQVAFRGGLVNTDTLTEGLKFYALKNSNGTFPNNLPEPAHYHLEESIIWSIGANIQDTSGEELKNVIDIQIDAESVRTIDSVGELITLFLLFDSSVIRSQNGAPLNQSGDDQIFKEGAPVVEDDYLGAIKSSAHASVTNNGGWNGAFGHNHYWHPQSGLDVGGPYFGAGGTTPEIRVNEPSSEISWHNSGYIAWDTGTTDDVAGSLFSGSSLNQSLVFFRFNPNNQEWELYPSSGGTFPDTTFAAGEMQFALSEPNQSLFVIKYNPYKVMSLEEDVNKLGGRYFIRSSYRYSKNTTRTTSVVASNADFFKDLRDEIQTEIVIPPASGGVIYYDITFEGIQPTTDSLEKGVAERGLWFEFQGESEATVTRVDYLGYEVIQSISSNPRSIIRFNMPVYSPSSSDDNTSIAIYVSPLAKGVDTTDEVKTLGDSSRDFFIHRKELTIP